MEVIKERKQKDIEMEKKIIFKTKEKQLEISFLDNLDLYFSFYSNNNDNNFEITKENTYIYYHFLELYNRIKNNDIVRLENAILKDVKTKEDLERKRQEIKEENEFIKRRGHYDELFHNDIITWKSGSNMDNFMTINKNDESIILSFNFTDNSHFITILNSGTYYTNYNIPFMEMFKKLMKNDVVNNQVEIDLNKEKAKVRSRHKI